MKQFNLLLVSLLLGVSSVFVSCSKEDDPSGPVITFTNDVDQTTMNSGETTWTITGNITSVSGLDNVKYFKVIGNSETQLGTTVTSFADKNDWDFTIDVTGITESMSIKVVATDKNDVTNSKSYTITVPVSTINSYSSTLLYVPDAAKNANVYFASTTGATYSYNGVGSNSGLVDWGYYYGTTAHHTFFALTQQPTLGYDITSWTKNATKFKLLTGVDFTATTTATAIETACGTIGTNEKIEGLAVNNVVGFKTAAGKFGLIKITAISADSNTEGTNITFSVKVQK